jgi:cation diffusion facilitator family transporter
MPITQQQRYQETRKVTIVGALANIILAVGKILFGWLGHSSALIADGIHSFSDLLTDILVILAAKFAHQEADSDHPYGHERIETAATVGLAVLLLSVGLVIIYNAVLELIQHQYGHRPDVYVLWVAGFSVVINELIYLYTKYVAKKIKSDILLANALHSRSDAASSLVVLIGVGGTLLGLPWLDGAAAIVVGLLIVKMGASIAWQNLRELVDTGVDDQTLEQIQALILTVQGVKAIHQLRTRKMAGKILVDLHIIVPAKVSVSEGHHIGEQVLMTLYNNIEDMHDVTIHVDSEDDELYSFSAKLPVREKLVPQLEQHWHTLPGGADIQAIYLHYLAGKVDVEIDLPLAVLTEIQPHALRSQYQQAVTPLSDVGSIHIRFV